MKCELRKVQQTTTGTYFVCLPREWAERHKLHKGDILSVYEAEEGRLFIDLERDSAEPKTTTLNAGPNIGRDIISRYLLGFDVIHIVASERIDCASRQIIKETAGSLVGLEIVEENSAQIMLQCLLDPSGFPPEKILCRNHAIVTSMNRDALISFCTGDLTLAKNVIARDDESNRLYFLLVRILRTLIQDFRFSAKLGIRPIDCLDYRIAASLVEELGDISVKIAKKTLSFDGYRLNESLQKLLRSVSLLCQTAQEEALKSFINKDASMAQNIRNLRAKAYAVYSEIEKLAKTQPPDMMPQILAVASYAVQTFEYCVDLGDLVA